MSAGLTVTKQQFDQVVGSISQNLQVYFNEIVNINLWLAANGVAGLEALGYTTAEANIIMSAFNDLGRLQQIFTGTVAQGATAYDFRTFVKQLWGLGDV